MITQAYKQLRPDGLNFFEDANAPVNMMDIFFPPEVAHTWATTDKMKEDLQEAKFRFSQLMLRLRGTCPETIFGKLAMFFRLVAPPTYWEWLCANSEKIRRLPSIENIRRFARFNLDLAQRQERDANLKCSQCHTPYPPVACDCGLAAYCSEAYKKQHWETHRKHNAHIQFCKPR